MTFWRRIIVFTICGSLHSSGFAANFDVLNNNPSGAGSLLQAITDLNSTGTNNPAASSNTISVNPAVGTITLGSDLPVITRGVTISKGLGSLTIDGASSFRIFATRGASLTVGSALSTTTLTNGLAQGGLGGTGNVFSASGGGGLGAGGAAYVDLGQQLSLINTTISSCDAIGGAGGSVSSGGGITAGGGGGASWNTSKNGGNTAGGGDFPGLSSPSSVGGTASEGVTGYGGGAGGAGFAGGTPGAAGGSGVGGNASGGTGGAGGYCGGGGGADASAGGGGGGGNGGGNNAQTAPVGGGGGGYGSGGAGGNATSGSAAGGGGGLGGGGGGGTGAFPNGGGGGGGFGGGGGGGGSHNFAFGGSGGLFGGNGSSGNSGGSTLGGGGGGGGALGGALFVGDGATLNIGDAVTITPGSNNVTGGAAGPGGVIPATAGTGYAPDIFLFKSATLNFNGAANQVFNTAIQSDQNNPAPPNPPIIIDNGVTVNLTVPASTITLGSLNNNWRGGTVITSGGITAAVTNLPPANTISIASQGRLTITGGANANTITNAGTLNFTGVASTSAPITNTGTMSTTAAFTNNSTITNSGTLGISTAPFTNNSILNNTSTGTINLNNTYTGVGTFTHAGILNINSVSFTPPAIFNNTGMTNLNGAANIVGDFSGTAGSGLTVGNASTINYSTSGSITGLTTLRTNPIASANGTVFTINGTVTGGDNSTFTIGANSTVNLNSGAVVTNFDSIVINGTYNIASGATYTLDSDNNLSGSTSGVISNQGQFFINGDITFPGTFSNLDSGTTTINGTPTLTFNGTNPFVNRGNLIANFSSSNSLPTINATGAGSDLSSGVISIGYNNNFIASGNYVLLNSGAPPVPGVAILPQNTFYISNWSLQPVGNSLVVSVTRNGFDDHALTPQAQEIGAFLELLGASNPNASQLLLLNAFEQIQNDSQLTTALLSLLPPQYTMLVTLELLDQITGALDIRLATVNRSYASGDDPGSDKVSAWIRPFKSEGTQQPDGTLNGYTDKNRGWLLGMDRSINHRLTLGAAGSYSKTTITDALQSNTITNVNTYQFTFYMTLRSPKDIYVDGLVAGGVSNYHGTRTIAFPGYVLGASSNYSSQQLTFKIRASKIFALADFWQLTPNAMAQYSFVRQLAFTENGAGSFNIYTNPDNINLFRLGVGTSLGIPFTTNNMLSIPSLYVGAYVDAKGGADTTNSQFVSGGPIITNSVQSGRLMLKWGAAYELKVNDNVEFVANYDYVWRNGFKGTEGLLNFRYTF